MRGALLVMLVLGACARGGGAGAGDDSGDDQQPDAAPAPSPDACVPMTTPLLVNQALDATPRGMGWIEQLIQPGTPLITDKDGRPEHTPPYKIWLGGFVAPIGGMVTDVLTQDVAIPAATRRLAFTGFFAVRTDETAGTAYDTAAVSLTQPGGAPIAAILELSNLTPEAAWAPFDHALSQDLSGQTVRLRLTSSNDPVRPTSFFFDSLALTAIHGCP